MFAALTYEEGDTGKVQPTFLDRDQLRRPRVVLVNILPSRDFRTQQTHPANAVSSPIEAPAPAMVMPTTP